MIYDVRIKLGFPDDCYPASTLCYNRSYPEYKYLYEERALTHDSLTIFKLINLLERVDSAIAKNSTHLLFKKKTLEKLERYKNYREKIIALIKYYQHNSATSTLVNSVELKDVGSTYYIPDGIGEKTIYLPTYKSRKSFKYALSWVDFHEISNTEMTKRQKEFIKID